MSLAEESKAEMPKEGMLDQINFWIQCQRNIPTNIRFIQFIKKDHNKFVRIYIFIVLYLEAAKPDAPKPVPIMIQPAKPASTILTEPAKPASTILTEPAKPASTATETVKPASTATETVKPASTGTETIRPVSTGTETVRPVSTGTETVKPTSAGTETVKPASTGTETVKQASTGTIPAKPEFAKPEPVTTDKTEKGPEPMEVAKNSVAKMPISDKVVNQNSTITTKKMEMKIINETLTSNVQGMSFNSLLMINGWQQYHAPWIA